MYSQCCYQLFVLAVYDRLYLLYLAISTFKDCPVADECWRSLCAKTRLFGPIDELHNSNGRILFLGFSLFFNERQVGFELI